MQESVATKQFNRNRKLELRLNAMLFATQQCYLARNLFL